MKHVGAMSAALVVAGLLQGCATKLPPPRRPLVATDYANRPSPPPVARVRSPEFPSVLELRRPGGTLWYTTDVGHEAVWVRVQTRRGEDGAYPYGLTDLTTAVLENRLRGVFGDDRVFAGADAHGAFVQVGTIADRLDFTLERLADALDGEPPTIREVDQERNLLIELLEHTDESPVAGAVQAARDQVQGRAAALEEGLRHFQSLYRSYDAEQVAAVRAERFAPYDRLILVTGDVDPAALVQSFDRHFGGDVPDPPRRAPSRPTRAMPEDTALSRPMAFPQAYVVFARPAPPITSAARLPYELIVDLLGGTFGSRLNGSLRGEHSYTYGAHASIDSSRLSDVLFIQAAFHPPKVRGALDELFDEMRSVRERPFSEQEIAAARRRVWARVQEALDGSGLPSVLARSWRMGLAPRQLEDLYRRLAEQTPDGLLQVAREWFHPREGILVVTGNFYRIGGWLVRRTGTGFHLEND
jgi:predicted Zn-dependent peptidase